MNITPWFLFDLFFTLMLLIVPLFLPDRIFVTMFSNLQQTSLLHLLIRLGLFQLVLGIFFPMKEIYYVHLLLVGGVLLYLTTKERIFVFWLLNYAA